MKKVILVLSAFVISFGAYAQTDSTTRKMSPPDINKTDDGINRNYDNEKSNSHKVKSNQIDHSHPDGAMMQNGKMMLVKDGKMTVMVNDVTMTNGTKVASNGSYVKKDGSKMMIKEGQHMDMSGDMVPMKTSKDPNMYLVPDSTRSK